MVKKALVCLFVLICTTAMFAGSKPVVAHTDRRIPGKAGVNNRATQSVLFTNFGPSGNEYNAGSGYFVTGPASPTLGMPESLGLPLVSASVINKVTVPIMYYGDGGDNYVKVCIYTDAGGMPGTQLKCKPASNLPLFGTTNSATGFSFHYTIPGGSAPVWIVIQEPSAGTGSSGTMVWNAHISNEAINVNTSGWFLFDPDTTGAMQVTGTP